jgi:hypothetical protein
MVQSFTSLCFIMLLLGAGFSVSAQRSNQAVRKQNRQPDIAKTSKKSSLQKSSSTDRQRAVTLLRQLAVQTASFPRDRDKPVKIALFQAEVADILWDYDEPRARAHFAETFKAADAFKRDKPGAFNPDMSLMVRMAIVRFILNHDANLAEKLVDSIAVNSAIPESTKPFPDSFVAPSTLYLEVAKQVAKSDPQRAARLIKHSMNGWIRDEQIHALQALRRSSPTLADELFVSLLSTFSSRPTYFTAKVGVFAPYVFPDDKELKSGNEVAVDAAKIPPSSPALIHSFLTFVYDNFMQQSVERQINEPNEFGKSAFKKITMEALARYFDQYMPEKAPLYRAHIEEVSNQVNQSGKREMWDAEDEEMRELFKMDVEDWLKKADAAEEAQEKDRLYFEAAFVLAARDSDFDRAFSITAKIADERMKSDWISMVREIAIKKTIESRDAARAYRYAKEVRERWPLVNYLTKIAALYVEQNEPERARQILKEAEKMLPETGDADSASLKVKVANVAASLQPEWGFTAMKIAVEAVNQATLAHDPSRGGIGYGAGKINFPDRFSYEQGFKTLARADFTRALQLTKSLQSKEASLLAQLAVCKGILRR